MSIILLVVAAILFITTFGIYSIMHNTQVERLGTSTVKSSIIVIAIVSGFILPVIPFTLIFNINFIWVFFINIPLVWIFGPIITKLILGRLATGKSLGQDMLYSLIGGIIALIIGIAIHNNKDDEIAAGNNYNINPAYKYEHRTGTTGNYQYNYDVDGLDNNGNSVSGNVDINGKYGNGTIEDEDGNEKNVDVEWLGAGQLQATDEDGNTYELEVN
jgi:hypothetical protein